MLRKETLGLKQQLADSLGEDGREYWKKLSEFFQARATKEELDKIAQATFTTPLQAKIHNKLLFAIIYNLTPNLPHPVGIDCDFVVKNVKRRKAQEKQTGKHLKKRFNRQCIASIPEEERARLNDLPTQHVEPFPIDQPAEYPKGIDGIPKTCIEDGDIPSNEALRSRMKFIGAFHGLDGNFGNDAVMVVNLALQNYLKNLMNDVLQKSPPGSKSVSLESLTFALQMTPQQLNSDLLETVCSIQM